MNVLRSLEMPGIEGETKPPPPPPPPEQSSPPPVAEEENQQEEEEANPKEKSPKAAEEEVGVVGPEAERSTTVNESMLRVDVMRNYLLLRDSEVAAASEATTEVLGSERCRAMVEVVKKEQGKWMVSKLLVEHNHELLVTPCKENGVEVPAIGMEFGSVDAAKAFYYGYGEKLGFKPRSGSNRRSVGNGALIMQRFLCWRGNYAAGRKRKDAVEIEAAAGEEVWEEECTHDGERKRGGRGSKRGGLVAARRKGKKSVEEEEEDEDWVIGLEAAAEEDEEEDGHEDAVDGMEEEEVNKESDKGKKKEKEKAVVEYEAENDNEQLLLRELGVKVSRYNNEERRKLLSKYLTKRQGKPGVGRPPKLKVASRQALAERRKRSSEGLFLPREGPSPPRPPSERRSKRLEKQNLRKEESKDVEKQNLRKEEANDIEKQNLTMEEAKTSTKADDIIEPEPDPPTKIVAGPGGEPNVGMVFPNEDKAYEFYVSYAGSVGFNVRKGWWDKTARNVTKSRSYVCSKEGFRPKNTSTESKKPRPETRTGCQAHMTIKITASGKYVVSEVVVDHNHELEAPVMDIQILRSQKLLAKVQQPTPEPQKVILIPSEYKNYLRSKRMKDIRLGDAGAICEYLQKMKGDNPSFFYAIQVDEEDQLTNIFWADAKSMMDYHFFGDVVCLDTRYSINEYGRPLMLFIGVNNHKQAIVFGSALIYDESFDSFRWLLETFKSAMSGKQPKTVLTDNSAVLSDAIAAVWPGTTHRLSVMHLYQNATKLLSNIFDSDTFAHDFSRWLYECEEEEEFLSAWEMLLEKYDLKDNDWMGKLYEDRERWALPYGRDTFCADILGSLRSDNMDTIFKELLKTDTDLPHFFNHYEKFAEEKRLAEQQADYLATQMTQRVPPLRLLWQVANAYTPAVFELFRLEFDLFLTCMVYSCGEIGTISEYEVTVKDKTRSHYVRFDSSDCVVVCSCKKFEFVGIPCCHVLKVLDLRNIKELPPHYILRRWRKDAQNESLRENYGFAFDEDPTSSLSKRYSSLCRLLYKVAAKAAENMEAYAFMESRSDQLLEQVEHILQARLHDKSSSAATLKSHQQLLMQNEGSNNDSRRASGKRNKNAESRRRNQSPLESNKRKKARQELQPEPEEAEVPLRSEPTQVSNAIPNHLRTTPNQFFTPSQLMQAYSVPAQQFGLSSLQGFHGLGQFNQMQESSAAALQQQPLQQPPFHGSTQMPQAPPPDIQSLQFLSSNTQLGHQNTDQGHYTIPVWDFL